MLVTQEFTDQDFESIKAGGRVSFDETTPAKIVLATVKRINDYEAQFDTRTAEGKQVLPVIEIDAKQCSTDTLVKLLHYAMNREDLVNASLLLNIFNLIKQYNSLSETYFDYPLSYVKSIEEFIDLKATLAPDIKRVSTQLAYWYLGALYSIHKTEITVIDKLERVPNLYHSLLLASDLFTLSAIFNKGDSIDTSTLPQVEYAYVYVVELASRLCITDAFVKDIEKSLKQADVK
nr:MAG TPA: hypothetical protein [Caudoviricetes sp.]